MAFAIPLSVMTVVYTRTGISLYRSVKDARALIGAGYVV